MSKTLIMIASRRNLSSSEYGFALCHNRTERLVAARIKLQKKSIPIRYDESRMDMSLAMNEIPEKSRTWFSIVNSAISIVISYVTSVTSIFTSSNPKAESLKSSKSVTELDVVVVA